MLIINEPSIHYNELSRTTLGAASLNMYVSVCVCVFSHHSKCGEAGGEQAFEAWDQIPLLALASYEILSKLF